MRAGGVGQDIAPTSAAFSRVGLLFACYKNSSDEAFENERGKRRQ